MSDSDPFERPEAGLALAQTRAELRRIGGPVSAVDVRRAEEVFRSPGEGDDAVRNCVEAVRQKLGRLTELGDESPDRAG